MFLFLTLTSVLVAERAAADYDCWFNCDPSNHVEKEELKPFIDWTDWDVHIPVSWIKSYTAGDRASVHLLAGELGPARAEGVDRILKQQPWVDAPVLMLQGSEIAFANWDQYVYFAPVRRHCPTCMQWSTLRGDELEWVKQAATAAGLNGSHYNAKVVFNNHPIWSELELPKSLAQLYAEARAHSDSREAARALSALMLNWKMLKVVQLRIQIAAPYTPQAMQGCDIPAEVRARYDRKGPASDAAICRGWREIRKHCPDCTWESWLETNKYFPGDRSVVDMAHTIVLHPSIQPESEFMRRQMPVLFLDDISSKLRDNGWVVDAVESGNRALTAIVADDAQEIRRQSYADTINAAQQWDDWMGIDNTYGDAAMMAARDAGKRVPND